MSDTKPLKCGKCNIQVKVAPNPQPTDLVSCPSCGDSDTFANVKKSLGEQATEWAQAKLAGAFSGNKNWKYMPSSKTRRNHRFILDFD